jgi:mRNA interferase HigB
MRIIALRTLKIYWIEEPNSEQALKGWFAVVKKAQWNNHNDLKEQLGKASIINSKRVVFNIHGNKYRLIADIEYKIQQIFIVWIGTHAEYDKINVEDVEYKKLD